MLPKEEIPVEEVEQQGAPELYVLTHPHVVKDAAVHLAHSTHGRYSDIKNKVKNAAQKVGKGADRLGTGGTFGLGAVGAAVAIGAGATVADIDKPDRYRFVDPIRRVAAVSEDWRFIAPEPGRWMTPEERAHAHGQLTDDLEQRLAPVLNSHDTFNGFTNEEIAELQRFVNLDRPNAYMANALSQEEVWHANNIAPWNIELQMLRDKTSRRTAAVRWGPSPIFSSESIEHMIQNGVDRLVLEKEGLNISPRDFALLVLTIQYEEPAPHYPSKALVGEVAINRPGSVYNAITKPFAFEPVTTMPHLFEHVVNQPADADVVMLNPEDGTVLSSQQAPHAIYAAAYAVRAGVQPGFYRQTDGAQYFVQWKIMNDRGKGPLPGQSINEWANQVIWPQRPESRIELVATGAVGDQIYFRPVYRSEIDRQIDIAIANN